jgi:transposase
MKKKVLNTVGIDVSKDHLDAYNYCKKTHMRFSNSVSGFKQMLKWIRSTNDGLKGLLFCFEHTGIYSVQLAEFLDQKMIPFVMVPGLEIKRSLGIARGKNDKIDSEKIARYAYLRRDEIQPFKQPSKAISKIKRLLSLRQKMVRQRARYQGNIGEFERILKKNENQVLHKAHHAIIKAFDKQILAIEKEILKEVKGDQKINETYKLVTSVKGVGFVLGLHMIVYTNCFSSFDNWRQFASYSGIAPFDYQSGKSKSPRRINHLANKKMKGLLSNAASTCIQFSPEMKEYYQRRLDLGKDKMSTQNIIRNKIVARVFAVVKRGTPYVDTMKFAA